MAASAESEARKALGRLIRAVEKAERELAGLRGALERAEGEDFPADAYDGAGTSLEAVRSFVREEGERLREKVLTAGGLEPGRVRRSPPPGGRG